MNTNSIIRITGFGNVPVAVLLFSLALASMNAFGQYNQGSEAPAEWSPPLHSASALSAATEFPDGLIGISSANDRLYIIDPATGAATIWAETNGNANFAGLSFLAGVLYGSDLRGYPGDPDPDHFDMGSIDPSGTITFLSTQNGSDDWHGLASGEAEGVLWAIDIIDGNQLVEQFPDGSVNVIGPTGIQGRGMAYDDGNGILYALGPGYEDQSLYTVNTETGESELVGPTGVTSYFVGLAFDECSGTLYMVATSDFGALNPSTLYTVDTATGAATEIGPTGFVDIDGLAWKGECLALQKEVTSGPDEFGPDNLVAFGDFESGPLNGAEFRLGIETLNEWYRSYSSGNDTGWRYETLDGNQYLYHAPFGGNDQKAFQVIDATGMAVGTKLRLEFDYVYNRAENLQQQGIFAGLVGIKDDGMGSSTPGVCDNADPPRYAAWPGTDWDGWILNWCYPPNNNPLNVSPDAVVLATTGELNETDVESFAPGWLETQIDQEYDAIVVVLMANSWDPSPTNGGLRGFDNIRLYASDGEIDKVVEIKPSEPIHYDFTIYYYGPREDVAVVDNIPAEWDVTQVDDTLVAPPLACGEGIELFRCGDIFLGELFRGGKIGKNCRSDTNLWWTNFPVGYLKVDAETRLNPGKGHKEDVYSPTSCGALYLNGGAAVYPAEDGQPLLYEEPLYVSNALCIAAVYDVNEDGYIARDGAGDEDGDGFSDYEEACEIGSDPCVFDHSDGDGISDDVDNCPYVDNPGQEDYDGNGVGDACEPCPCFIGIPADSPYFETAISGTNLCDDGITSIVYPVFYFNFTDESIGTVGVGFQEYCDAPTEYFCGGGPAGSFSLSLEQYEDCVEGPGWEPVAPPG